jgi:hypothetical protein
MKVYSDSLTFTDLRACAEEVGLTVAWDTREMQKPRIRTFGWEVRLHDADSKRYYNSGPYGARDRGAPSWDRYGHWMARIFQRDANARIAEYNGAEEFHRVTANKYEIREVSA